MQMLHFNAHAISSAHHFFTTKPVTFLGSLLTFLPLRQVNRLQHFSIFLFPAITDIIIRLATTLAGRHFLFILFFFNPTLPPPPL